MANCPFQQILENIAFFLLEEKTQHHWQQLSLFDAVEQIVARKSHTVTENFSQFKMVQGEILSLWNFAE